MPAPANDVLDQSANVATGDDLVPDLAAQAEELYSGDTSAAQTRNWHALTAAELGLPAGADYTFTGGVFTQTDPEFGDANASVLSGVYDGQRTLLINFQGSDQDADILYSFVDSGHLGVVEAAKKADNVKLLGVIAPKCDISDGLELGDSIARQDELVYKQVEDMVNGNADNIVYGIQDPDVAGFVFCDGEGSAELTDKAEEVRAKFESGELKRPASTG